MRQRHIKEMDLPPHTADHADSLAKIHLPMAGRMSGRNKMVAVLRGMGFPMT